MTMRYKRPRLSLSAVKLSMAALLPICLGSCMLGPDFQEPAAPDVKSYTEQTLPLQTVEIKGEEEKTQSFLMGEDISNQWWVLFQCPALTALINQGLKNSPTIEIAQAALTKASENVNVAYGGLFPSIDAQATVTREKESESIFGLNAPPLLFNLYNPSLNLSYGLDFFGALRRQIEAQGALVDYQTYELEAAYLSLTANIVTTAIQEASLRGQIQVSQELISSQEKQLNIMISQHRLGGISQADIYAQSTLVAQTKATLPPLHSALAQSRHRLAVLVGEFPAQANLPEFTLSDLHLPTELPVTLPSVLVRQRPDIKAAEALLHQANAQIGVATANMFPSLTLTGSVGSVANHPNQLFASNSNIWSIAAQLLQPVFRGGAMIAQKNAATAAYDQAFATYRQTVLQAFQNVADVLQAVVEDARTYQAQKDAEDFAFQALELSRKQYHLGGVSFLMLLVAERQYQQTRIARIQAEAARYSDTANLFQALGGIQFLKISETVENNCLPPQTER